MESEASKGTTMNTSRGVQSHKGHLSLKCCLSREEATEDSGGATAGGSQGRAAGYHPSPKAHLGHSPTTMRLCYFVTDNILWQISRAMYLVGRREAERAATCSTTC